MPEEAIALKPDKQTMCLDRSIEASSRQNETVDGKGPGSDSNASVSSLPSILDKDVSPEDFINFFSTVNRTTEISPEMKKRFFNSDKRGPELAQEPIHYKAKHLSPNRSVLEPTPHVSYCRCGWYTSVRHEYKNHQLECDGVDKPVCDVILPSGKACDWYSRSWCQHYLHKESCATGNTTLEDNCDDMKQKAQECANNFRAKCPVPGCDVGGMVYQNRNEISNHLNGHEVFTERELGYLLYLSCKKANEYGDSGVTED